MIFEQKRVRMISFDAVTRLLSSILVKALFPSSDPNTSSSQVTWKWRLLARTKEHRERTHMLYIGQRHDQRYGEK